MGLWDRINPANIFRSRQETPLPVEVPPPAAEVVPEETEYRSEDLRTIEVEPEKQFYYAARDLADALGGDVVGIGPGLVGVAFSTEDDAEVFYTFLSKNPFLQDKGAKFAGFDADFRGRSSQDDLVANEARWMYTGVPRKYLVRFKPAWE